MKAEDLAGVYPLSPLQQGMLFHALYAPESGVYVEQYTCVMQGRLNFAAFKRAWQTLMDRHTALRTSFFWKDMEKPVQLVHRTLEAPVTLHDWSQLSAQQQQTRLDEFLKQDRIQGFNPAKAPLLRVNVFQTGEDTHRLVWTFHHLLADGWSYLLSLREVYTAYEAYAAGREPELPPARPYGEYIAWLQKQNLDEAKVHWQRTLKGFTAPTPIGGEATQSNSAPLHTDSFGELTGALTAEQSNALKAFARQQQVTLNTVLQGAFALLLSRYSNETDVVFGATVSGRPAELTGVEKMVGMFINSLPVRVPAPPHEKLRPWLQQIQQSQVQQRKFECSPLLEIQGWSDVPRNLPLFESLLVFENVPAEGAPWEAGSLKFRDIRFLSRAHYPLCLMVIPREVIAFRVMYDGVRVDAAAAERLLGHLKTLLDAMVKQPNVPLGLLPILTDAEMRQIVQWTGGTQPYPREKCIHQLFEEQAARTPNAVAVSFEKQTLTYRELNQRANQLAHRLRRMGIGPEVMVGMCLERSIEMIVATLAIVKAGGVYVPLDPAYPAERLTFMIQDTATPVLITTTKLLDSLPPNDTKLICLDAETVALGRESKENLPNLNTAENLAYVMYTSGSTGRPKGTCVPHHAVVRLVRNTNYMRFGPDEVFMQFAPVSFDAATLEIWGALLHGARLAVFPPHLPSLDELGRFMKDQRVTMLWITTGLFHQMVEECFEGLKPLKQILTGGDVLSVPHMKKTAAGIKGRLIACYGPTENTTFTSTFPIEDINRIGASVSIGRPIANSSMYILDRQMNLVPVGVPGEIHIGGEGLSRGYLNRPELTAEKFVPNPFGKPGERLYRTGDLAKYRADGNIDFCGRIDNQVKIRGFRVEPAEIEAVLLKHTKVRDAVITVRKDKSGSKSLIAYCAPFPGQTLTADDLRAYLGGKLPPHMMPSVFMVLETLPLNANGKVDRKALPDPETARTEHKPCETPQTELEKKLAKIWEEVLSVRAIGRRDNFFELGGHSLLATRLFTQIDKHLGKHLPLATLFQAPSIAQLASFIEGKEAPKPASSLLAIQAKGTRRPFFCVQAGDGSVLLFANLANRLGKDQPFYVLQQPGLDAKREYFTKIEELAAQYIQEIRRVQPTGPYLLGGVCFGGKVAFEMAQQLEAAGERVSLLAVFDSYAPRKPQPRTLFMRIRGFAHRVRYHIGYMSIFGPRYIVERARARARWLLYKAYADSSKPLPHELRYFHAEEVNARIQQQYEPKIYPGRVTVFRSYRQLAEWSFGPHLGWGPLAAAGVDIQTVSGAFGAMFGEPFVAELAAKLQHSLDEVERAAPYGRAGASFRVAELISG